MKNILTFSFIFFGCFQINAQSTKALIGAENAFEKTCFEKGIRDGFLAYVDSNGIVLTKKEPVNAKKFWSELQALDGLFSWSPSYAEMSLSGDWGYTTGNYEHRPRASADSVDEAGQYTTVWHKIENGEWKYLVDIGTRHPRAALEKQTKTITVKKYSSGNDGNEDQLNNIEKEYIQSFEKNIDAAFQKYSSNNYILNITGNSTITSSGHAALLLHKMVPSIKYYPKGIKISTGKDMAAVYGNFNINEKTGNYLRIWRHEINGWKIALEVIKL